MRRCQGQIHRDLRTRVPGIVPSLIDLPTGCRFAARCTARVENDLAICLEKEPTLEEVAPNHKVRCWLYDDATKGIAEASDG